MGNENDLLLRHFHDLAGRAYGESHCAFTGFLNTAEQELLLTHKDEFAYCGVTLYGGTEGCERQMAAFGTDSLPGEAFPIACVRIVPKQQKFADALTHRDFLGSLMGMGIVREKVGDILVGPDSADLVVLDTVEDFLLQSWDSAGRERLTVAALPSLTALAPQAPVFTEVRDTVASLRLDGVASAGFGVSRGKAAEAIQRGAVQVNHTVCLKPDKPVAAGDVITCRGWGRCVLGSVGSPTRKGRLPIVIQRYS